MCHAAHLTSILRADRRRMLALEAVGLLGLPDCWIAAGFVRDAMWDDLHGFPPTLPGGDVDVIWFDAENADPEIDRALERQLRSYDSTLDWSVKNQARMHRRNGDKPYHSVADAMTYWPETATAIAVRMAVGTVLEVNAPFGLDDLYGLRLVPTPAFAAGKYAVFESRVAAKRWRDRYPLLSFG